MKTETAQPIAKFRLLRVRRDFGDDIHVNRSAWLAGRFVSDQEASYTATGEH